MFDFDSAWKEAIDAYFELSMAFFFADAHREIDWARGFEMLDKELQQISPDSEQGRRVADKLVKVWRTNGQEEWVLVHIEIQSQQEVEMLGTILRAVTIAASPEALRQVWQESPMSPDR